MFSSRKNIVFIILAGIFITNAIVAELIGGKLIQLGSFTLSIGILPWPIVFITTDLINEYFGKSGVKKLTYLTSVLIAYVFIILFIGIKIPATSFSPVSTEAFKVVFGQGEWIIIGGLVAFIVSQLLDASIFSKFKKVTGDKHIWLRATGSTVISQLIDTFIVLGIAFYLPGKISLKEFVSIGFTGYFAKLLIAIGLTPMIYLAHGWIKKYLKKEITPPIID
ncbi:queuosine precursor transporter [Crocinitomicaceae bacterium]|nr:queuosine precursor transporter [Crocinitomicaceae bacterium]